MNLPSSNPLELGIDVSDFDVRATFNNFLNANFTGFLAATIEGYDGAEEGVFVFKAGHVVSASYEYLKHDLVFSGERAVPRVFNALSARNGVIDVFSLSKEQVDLVLNFNSETVLKVLLKSEDVAGYASQAYTERLAEEVIGSKSEKFRSKDVLKKYKLQSLIGSKRAGKSASKPEKEESEA